MQNLTRFEAFEQTALQSYIPTPEVLGAAKELLEQTPDHLPQAVNAVDLYALLFLRDCLAKFVTPLSHYNITAECLSAGSVIVDFLANTHIIPRGNYDIHFNEFLQSARASIMLTWTLAHEQLSLEQMQNGQYNLPQLRLKQCQQQSLIQQRSSQMQVNPLLRDLNLRVARVMQKQERRLRARIDNLAQNAIASVVANTPTDDSVVEIATICVLHPDSEEACYFAQKIFNLGYLIQIDGDEPGKVTVSFTPRSPL